MSDNYLTVEIPYNGGHKCVPNRVGDYQFVCPTLGEVGGFVPFMLRTLVKGKCFCGTMIVTVSMEEFDKLLGVT